MSQPSFVVWLFGLPCAGKTSLGDALHDELARRGVSALRLDGDQLRKGLCADLGFSHDDRTENIRRAAHVARLACKGGIPVIASFITPTHALRDLATGIVGGERFLPVFVDCPVDECSRRDVKGLYARARAGQLTGLTGADAGFDPPGKDGFTIRSDARSIEECVQDIVAEMRACGWLEKVGGASLPLDQA